MPTELRVAIVGSGPAGFYVAEHLLKQTEVSVRIDMFDRLPTPFGLVRFGVAPDHPKIKSVTRVFDKIARNGAFRFYGNVEIGKDLTLAELKGHYHQICFATGAQTDRAMGIPGEDLPRSHPATEFVAWYNGHPDYRDHQFDLSVERVAVVGVGNVAMDVARILSKSPEELAKTDIADHALEALRHSKVRQVTVLGRRGPAQAAFTNPEVRELGELEGADVSVVPEEVRLDPASQAEVDAADDDMLRKKVEILQGFAEHPRSGKARLLTLRFLVSPIEVVPGPDGGVAAMRLARNELYAEGGQLRSRSTGDVEEMPVDLVFRSVGYRGVRIPGVPFDERSGVVPNDQGRVTDPDAKGPVLGTYVSGWIKRGPSGIIGTNKKDGTETATAMLADAAASKLLSPVDIDPAAIDALVRSRRPDLVTYGDWSRLDALETAAGERSGRTRVKLVTRDEVAAALASR